MGKLKDYRLRSSFACDICRRIKMRCVPLNGNSSDPKPPCQRCARIGHRCTFQGLDQAPPSGKKRRKSRKKVMEDRQRKEDEELIKQNQYTNSISKPSKQQNEEISSTSSTNNDYMSLLDSPLIPSTAESNILFDRLQSMNDEPINSFSFSTSSIGTSTINTETETNLFEMNSDELDSPVSNDCTTITTESIHIPEKMHPLALLAEASLGIDSNLSTQGGREEERVGLFRHSNQTGSNNQNRYLNSNMMMKYWLGNEIPPIEHKVITNKILNWNEIEELFEIYFKGYAQHFVILDPSFHTIKMVSQRSSVLLTTICAIASRSYPLRPNLYKELFELANNLISTSITDGIQSIELIQSLLLLSMWPLPMSRWEDGKSWLFSGIALRMATELNLHELGSQGNELKLHPSFIIEPETIIKEIRNRERCFLTCFSVDQSFSTMRGRPTVLPVTELILEWDNWINNPICKRWEVGICAFVDLMSMLTEQCKTIQSIQKVRSNNINSSLESFSEQHQTNNLNHSPNGTLLAQIHVFDEKIEEWREKWMKKGLFHHSPLPQKNSNNQKETELDHHLFYSIVEQMPSRYNYAKLIINSIGLQHCLLTNARSTEIDVLFSRCWRACFNLLNAALEGMRPLIQFLPDTQFLVICYASVFLLKLRCHPMASLSKTKNVNAILLVIKVAKLLDSVDIEPNHHPGIYSSFLWSILRKIGDQIPYRQQDTSNSTTRESSLSTTTSFNNLNAMRQKGKAMMNEQGNNENNRLDSTNSISKNSEEKEIVDAFFSNIQESLSTPQPLLVQWPEAFSGSDFDFGCGNLMEFKESLLNSQQENDVIYQEF